MSIIKEELTDFGYGTNGDEFKPLAEVLLSDARQKSFVRLQGDGYIRRIRLEEVHARISEINLNSNVAVDIRTGFDTARNLLLYSWFVYRFQTVAELQAYATLELALKMRMGSEGIQKKYVLKDRLKFALKKGWLKADKIRVYREKAENLKRFTEEQVEIIKRLKEQNEQLTYEVPVWDEEKHAQEYLDNLIEAIPRLRNTVAHGFPMLHGGAVRTLEICCDLINQLYPDSGDNPAKVGDSSVAGEIRAADGVGGE